MKQLIFDFIEIRTEIPNEEELRKIFDYYIFKYFLGVDLYFVSYVTTGYDYKINYIDFNIGQILRITKDKNRDNAKNDREFLIFVLLHEIKHAIDWQENKE